MTEPATMTKPAATPLPTARVDAHHHVWDLAVRDQPWTAGLAPPYDEVLAVATTAVAGLSAAERQSVFAGTATRFYRLAR